MRVRLIPGCNYTTTNCLDVIPIQQLIINIGIFFLLNLILKGKNRKYFIYCGININLFIEIKNHVFVSWRKTVLNMDWTIFYSLCVKSLIIILYSIKITYWEKDNLIFSFLLQVLCLFMIRSVKLAYESFSNWKMTLVSSCGL